MSATLYCYADRTSGDSIIGSKIMHRSADTIADARQGVGVYFADIDPYNFTAEQLVSTTGCRIYHLRLDENWNQD